MKVKSESEVTQSCPTLRDPIDCSLPGSSVHGIFQARVQEWGAMEFQFQILKDEAVKVLHSICQPIWKMQQWPQDWKRSVFIPILKKDNAKERSNYCTTALISHASKVMPQILQARFQQYMNWEIPDVQARFRKGRETRGQIADIHWIIERAREFQKHVLLLYWLCQSLWLCRPQENLENSSRDMNTRPPDLPPEKSVGRSRSNG